MKKIFLLALAVVALACTKDPNGEDGTPKDRSIHGYAQKGQFVKGSQVTAFAIGKDLIATGESFPANISDDLGAFSISGKTGSPYLELRAEGYYFNDPHENHGLIRYPKALVEERHKAQYEMACSMRDSL